MIYRPRYWPLLVYLGVVPPPAVHARPEPAPLAVQALTVLRHNCYDCHGKDPEKLKGKLNLFDPAYLADAGRKLVVAAKPDESLLIKKVDEAEMPPDPRPKLKAADRKTLRDWIASGAPALPLKAVVAVGPSAKEDPAALAEQVKGLFRSRCLECHGGSKTNGGVKILDYDLLVNKKNKVVPGKPVDSVLFQLITATDSESAMPPAGQPRLGAGEIDVVRRWIAVGAPPFPADVAKVGEPQKDPAFKDVAGVDYVLKRILAHVRSLPAEGRRNVRYFSINHALTAGATAEELQLQRDALAIDVNHLSWENRIVPLTPIDPPVNTVFAVDMRQLGWDFKPYGGSAINLFDLVLLEYPYGIAYEGSPTFDDLVESYIRPAGLVRPVPYVRADWFVSTATRSPLYEDLLQLPFTLAALEERLGVDSAANLRDGRAKRAGLAVSGVSRNNRVVERHDRPGGAYWRSYDFRTGTGTDNLFQDPIDLHPGGGEMIFTLPNGLQGYFIIDARGNRVEAAPTEIVTDKFAADKVVRNGMACMRCHDQGMKGFQDGVRPYLLGLPGRPGFDRTEALRLYPEQSVMDVLYKEDGERFVAALGRALGKPPAKDRSPLTPVTQRYLDESLHLATAAGELGLADPRLLQSVTRMPQFTKLGLSPLALQGVVRRDAWETHFDEVASNLGLGLPVAPFDGVTRRTIAAADSPTVELTTSRRVTEKGDKVKIVVANKSPRPAHIELFGTSAKGEIVPLITQVLASGEAYRSTEFEVKAGLGKEQITLFACEHEFPAGEVLRGKGVTDRLVHRWYGLREVKGRLVVEPPPAGLVKTTIEIETR